MMARLAVLLAFLAMSASAAEQAPYQYQWGDGSRQENPGFLCNGIDKCAEMERRFGPMWAHCRALLELLLAPTHASDEARARAWKLCETTYMRRAGQ
jgi:hypothetical protein